MVKLFLLNRDDLYDLSYFKAGPDKFPMSRWRKLRLWWLGLYAKGQCTALGKNLAISWLYGSSIERCRKRAETGSW